MTKLFLLFSLLVFNISFGQEELAKSNFQFHSISFNASPISMYHSNGNYGLQATFDVTFSSGKHLFTLMPVIGSEFDIFDPSDEFAQVNLLYGRQIKLIGKTAIDLHAGIGYFRFTAGGVFPTRIPEKGSTIGFPVAVKFRVHTGPRFSLGLQLGYNYNSISPVASAGIVLQWNRRQKEKE